jgi:hypothetical protein
MLSRRLLLEQIQDEKKIDNIVDFLCSGSGSHDYAIHHREARDELGLNIQKPDDELYEIIKNIYNDIVNELQLTSVYDPNQILGAGQNKAYSLKRALLESTDSGGNYFISEGVLTKQVMQIQPGLVQPVINDQRTFEGWR